MGVYQGRLEQWAWTLGGVMIRSASGLSLPSCMCFLVAPIALELIGFRGPLPSVRSPGLPLRASLDSSRGCGGGMPCGQVPGMITARRAAPTVAGQAKRRERASAAPGGQPSPRCHCDPQSE